jgi:hypothetical protein
MNNRGKQAIGQSAHPGEEDFYRKGIVGDWKNHFDPEMLDDIGRIEQRGLGLLEWMWLKIRALPREILPKILRLS